MIIKQLDRSYLEELVKLDSLSFKPLTNKLGRRSAKDTKDYFIYTFKKGKLFGYFINEKLIGCIGIIVDKKHNYVEIEHIIVNPKHQKRGIGRELMDFIKNIARKQGLENLRLNVRCKNDIAFNFYKKYGFNKHAYTMTMKL